MYFHPVQMSDLGTAKQLLTFVTGSAIVYFAIRSIYRVYFHPLSKYPGPRIAAVSDAWYAYHTLIGRWPWAVEDAIRQYGDVVRIAPNELVFATPQALADLHGSHNKNIETFPKTQINNQVNDEHGGIIWEWDPVRHHQVAKQLAPAFSGRALKAKEPALYKCIDLFVDRMKEFGNSDDEGVSLPTWVNWACVDISGAMAYSREMNALKDMKDPAYLSLLSRFSKSIVVIQMSWRFPLLSPLKYLFILAAAIGCRSDVREHNHKQLEQLERRIGRKGAGDHPDYFEQIIPGDPETSKNPKELRHLEQVVGQLLVAGYEPAAMWLYGTIYYLLENPWTLAILTEEIRTAFQSYEDITASATSSLPYLTGCLKETLRIFPNILTGMPVVSPGAMVDGTFIPKNVVCQSSPMAMGHDPRNFRDPLGFRPERWLPEGHALHDAQFADDNRRKAFQPFSQGPRRCTGTDFAWRQGRVFMARVLWTFNLEMVPGQDIDMHRDLRGWGLYKKPEVRVRFVPARGNKDEA